MIRLLVTISQDMDGLRVLMVAKESDNGTRKVLRRAHCPSGMRDEDLTKYAGFELEQVLRRQLEEGSEA